MDNSQPSLLPPPVEINNAHKVYSIAAWVITLCLLSSSCVLWRLGVRISNRAVGADDYVVILALVR